MLPKASDVLKELLENLNIDSVSYRTEQVMVRLLEGYFDDFKEKGYDEGYKQGVEDEIGV